MFSLRKNKDLLTFAVERPGARFGEGSRILFWVDRERGVLQRGRQESIPLATIGGFGVDAGTDGPALTCRLGEEVLTLYAGKEAEEGEAERLRGAARELAVFCGVEIL